jgi:hypothetical protein
LVARPAWAYAEHRGDLPATWHATAWWLTDRLCVRQLGVADQRAFTLAPRDCYLNTVYPELLRAEYAVVISDYVGLGTRASTHIWTVPPRRTA